MSSTLTGVIGAGTTEPARPIRSGAGARRLVAPLAMFVLVALGAGLPLIGNHIFYFWDDTAAVGVPVWHRIAGAVLHGDFPLLNLDMWRGGDFAAEASTGMWNPVTVAIAVLIYPIDNLAVGITIGKTLFMLIMSGGMYLLSRSYGVSRALSAVAGTVMPLAGYSFFMDATSWVNALMLTAFTPWVWWTARLVVSRRRSLGWLILAGYLAVSLGNPYGLVSTGVAILAVIVEAWFAGRRGKIIGLAAAGLAILLLNVMTYLPLLLTSSLGYRVGSQTSNDGVLKPSLTNLLELSTPSTQPEITSFSAAYLTVPVMYLAWFVLPSVPWLRWRTWRSAIGLYTFAGVFLLLMLGPSQIWMFRWPLRLIDFLWLPVVLAWVVLADRGFERSRWRLRMAMSAAIVALGAYLAWGERPQLVGPHVYGAVVVLLLVWLLVRFGPTGRAGFLVLTVGSLLVLGLQVLWFPANHSVTDYRFPTSARLLQERFAKYPGTVVQVASLVSGDLADRSPSRNYEDMLFGSMYSVAGVESTTGYSGIGFTRFDSAQCMAYEGNTCPQAWPALWQHPAGYSVPLVDLLRGRTVVVQNALLDTRSDPAPPGWRRAPALETSGLATVWTRDQPPPWPHGRLSYASDGVQVVDDHMLGAVDEQLTYTLPAGHPAALTFARLAWPGYRATVNGRAVRTEIGPAGLLVVDLPAGVHAGEVALSWRPPGSTVSAAAFGIGALLTSGLVLVPVVGRRRSRFRRESTA
jgi:hypothetical protein